MIRKFALASLCFLLTGLPVFTTLALAQDAKGTLTGFIGDARSGDFIRGASVEIVGTSTTVTTGVDGDFNVELPAGTYSVRFTFDGYTSQTREGIEIVAGDTIQLDAVLSPVGYGEQVTIVAGAGGDIAAQYEDRKTATTISDAVSKAEMAADPSSSAAGVLQRVTGVTVQDDFVFVRGLGERYSNTVINDALVPTPQPDRKVVPMDLIPTNLLQSVKILKTFTPDQPGEFSGGLVRLETVELPKSASLSVGYSIGFNDQTHGGDLDFLSYPGDSLDFFGFGLNRRALPSIIPTDERLLRGNIFVPGGYTPEELQVFGQSFENVWSPEAQGTRPDFSGTISGGNTFGKLGVVGAIGLKNEQRSQRERRIFYQIDTGGELTEQANYDYDVSEETSRLGATANLAYQLSTNHKLFFKNLFSNQSTDEARIFEGLNGDRGNILRNQRLRYVNERILTSQVSGNHLFSAIGNAILDWRFTYSRARLDEPDLREALYEQSPITGDFTYLDQNQSLFRLFNTMRENLREPAFDVSRFWFLSKVTFSLKAGASYSNRDRFFESRRFRFTPRSLFGIDLTQTPEQLLVYDNINPTRGFEIREETRNTDTFVARQDVTAGYLMGDVTLGKWRFIGGARVERSIQQVRTFEPFKASTPSVNANLDNTDWLPSFGAVYALTPTQNIRAGYSRTLSRPQFRELSPFEFTDVTGGRSSVGNPDLLRTIITNYDVRYEWYLSPDEIFSVGYFYKGLDDPIENVVEPGANIRTSFRNADRAKNQGLEFEFRKNLGFVWNRLANATVSLNYTYVDSNVEIGEQDLSIVTSTERPLVGQSKHIFNSNIAYEIPKWQFDARLFFNYTGERITDVGSLGLPDILEHGFPALDARFSKKFGGGDVKRWSIDFEMQNLLNRQHDERQGGLPFRVYRSGRDFQFGVSYTIF